ncbi:Exocyst complex component 7 [Armadillidium vulgare]|nr:Exocyst complex component 7 [Armadillidium vulgare]
MGQLNSLKDVLNTEKTLQALDYVIAFYSVAGEVEGVVRERPNSIGIGSYLQAMDKLKAACKFFQDNNPQSSELENVKSLFEHGCQQLSIEFRDELKKYQKPLSPHITLELIELDESEMNEELLSSIDLIPVSIREDLKSIAFWLDKNGTTDRLTVYAKQRSYVLLESLKALKVFQKSSSGERGATLNHSLNSPALSRSRGIKLDVSRIRTAKISQKATRALLRAMPVQPSSRRQGTPHQIEDTLDEHDVAVYINQVTALHRLSFSELLLARQLVPQDKVTRTFELIIKDAINDLVGEGEHMASQAHKSVSKGDIQAVLSLLTLLRHMTVMNRQFETLLFSCQPSIKAQFAAIVNTLQDTTGNALDAFVNSLRSEGERALPKDGTVHELTKRVLSYLGFALVHRSSAYSDPTLCAIFRLNNYNYIFKSLQNSDLLTVVTLAEHDCAKMYRELILEQKEIYSESLKKLLSYLNTSDDASLSSLNESKLKDKERHLIKERFSGFNKEIEEMQRVQRGYSIPDLELRESIKRDNKEQILPKYQAFYDKFSQIQFSKTSGKYIKYTPVDVSYKLDEFFDVAA